MRFLILFGFAICGSVFAANKPAECSHTDRTAQRELSAIYAAEKAYFAEKSEFSEEFGEIGYDPNIADDDAVNCDVNNWDFAIERVERPSKFIAVAHSRITGEEITINEKKEIQKSGLKISSSPVE